MIATVDADDAIAKVLSGLIGAWPHANTTNVGRPSLKDPLGAIACVFDRPTQAGPLNGLRLAIKDNIAVAGVATSIGSGEAGFVGNTDAVVVARAGQAGAQLVAKAQCEAFLLGANSYSSPWPVRNPYDLRHSAGGSSSGSAAMLASRLVDIALGTDSGGSIRIPAAHCGLVGLAPTRGRVSYTGIAPLEPFLERVGPMACDVAKTRSLFSAIDGADDVDPRTAWCPFRDRPAAAPPIDKIKIGILDQGCALASDVVAKAINDAILRFEKAGASCLSVRWSAFEEAQQLHLAIYLIGDALAGRCGLPGIAATFPPGWSAWRAGASVPTLLATTHAAGDALIAHDPGLYERAIGRSLEIGDALDALLGDFDVLVLPTTPDVASLMPDEPTPEQVFGDTRLTAPFNVTGHPAISIPCGLAAGLPIGLQLVGRRGHDFALLAVAEALASGLETIPTPEGDFGAL